MLANIGEKNNQKIPNSSSIRGFYFKKRTNNILQKFQWKRQLHKWEYKIENI